MFHLSENHHKNRARLRNFLVRFRFFVSRDEKIYKLSKEKESAWEKRMQIQSDMRIFYQSCFFILFFLCSVQRLPFDMIIIIQETQGLGNEKNTFSSAD